MIRQITYLACIFCTVIGQSSKLTDVIWEEEKLYAAASQMTDEEILEDKDFAEIINKNPHDLIPTLKGDNRLWELSQRMINETGDERAKNTLQRTLEHDAEYAMLSDEQKEEKHRRETESLTRAMLSTIEPIPVEPNKKIYRR